MTPTLRNRLYWYVVGLMLRAVRRIAPTVVAIIRSDGYQSGLEDGYEGGFQAGYVAGRVAGEEVGRSSGAKAARDVMRADLLNVQQTLAAQRQHDYMYGYRAGLAVQVAETQRAAVIAPQGRSNEFLWTTLPPRMSC